MGNVEAPSCLCRYVDPGPAHAKHPSAGRSDHPSGSTYGQTVQFTATVSSASGTPTGSIQFEIDGTDVGTPVTLLGDTASFSTSALNAANHTITAVYASDDPELRQHSGRHAGRRGTCPDHVTATSTTKVYGDVLPALTYTTTTSSMATRRVRPLAVRWRRPLLSRVRWPATRSRRARCRPPTTRSRSCPERCKSRLHRSWSRPRARPASMARPCRR